MSDRQNSLFDVGYRKHFELMGHRFKNVCEDGRYICEACDFEVIANDRGEVFGTQGRLAWCRPEESSAADLPTMAQARAKGEQASEAAADKAGEEWQEYALWGSQDVPRAE